MPQVFVDTVFKQSSNSLVSKNHLAFAHFSCDGVKLNIDAYFTLGVCVCVR